MSAGGAIWVGNIDDQTVSIIDPATGLVRVTGAGGKPDALGVGPTSVWVLDGSLGVVSEISLAARHPLTRRILPVPDFVTKQGVAEGCGCTKGAGYSDLISVGRSFWVTNRVSGQIRRSVTTRSRQATTSPCPPPGRSRSGSPRMLSSGINTPENIELSGTGAIASSSGTVWVASDLGQELWRIDPGSSTAQLVAGPNHGSTVALETGVDALWATHPDGFVVRTSPTTYTATEIKVVTGRPGSPLPAMPCGWRTPTMGTISRIDPQTNEVVATIPVGSNPVGVVVANGQPFVTLRGP